MIHVTKQAIIDLIVSEALDDVDTGWLSDVVHFDPVFESENEVISLETPSGDLGSIDIGQLAGVIQELIRDVTR